MVVSLTVGLTLACLALGLWVRLRQRKWRQGRSLLAQARREQEQKALADIEAAPTKERVELEQQREACSFWFVRADYLRHFSTATDGVTPPAFQQLRQLRPDALQRQTISSAAAFSGAYVRTHCVVSHRWLSPLAPDDAEGSQLQAVQSHVRALRAC